MNTQSNHPTAQRSSRFIVAIFLLAGLILNASTPFGWAATPASAANYTQVNPTASPGADEATLHGKVIGDGTAGERPTADDGGVTETPITPTATLIPSPTITPTEIPTETPTPIPGTPVPTQTPGSEITGVFFTDPDMAVCAYNAAQFNVTGRVKLVQTIPQARLQLSY